MGIIVYVRFHGSFYCVSIETTNAEYIILRACPLPLICNVHIDMPVITNILSSLCHFNYYKYISWLSTSHRWYIVLVNTAIIVIIA